MFRFLEDLIELERFINNILLLKENEVNFNL